MTIRVLGSILLLIGTSIGGAMLALPVATAAAGFFHSLLLLVLAWIIMLVGALFILEVNLWLTHDKNLVSMAKETLGPIGQVVTWIAYVLLFYTLLSGYISGGSDMLSNLLALIHLHVPRVISAVIFTLVFGFILFKGISAVDWVNRLLMSLKLFAYIVLVALLLPHVNVAYWQGGSYKALLPATMTAITSFGFAASVPTIRAYLNSNIKQVRLVVILGSFVPLICYILWDAAVQGDLSAEHLIAISHSGHAVSELTKELTLFTHSELINIFAHFFTSICVLTAFLGVGIAVTDFFADGFKVEKKGFGALLVMLATLFPPFIIVFFHPALFLKAMSFAGVCCVILLALLPSLMVLSGRYFKKIASIQIVPGGKIVVIAWIIISVILLLIAAR